MLFDKPIYAILKNRLKDNVIAYKNKIRNLKREKIKSGGTVAERHCCGMSAARAMHSSTIHSLRG